MNAGGRPPFFSSPEELLKMITAYFEKAKGNSTITGLAYDLGFESRQSFYDYEKREEFSYIIKRARLFVESCYELKLSGQYIAGSVFALKNMGWSDKQEIEQHGTTTITFKDAE